MQSVPEKETMDAIAELFKGFADSTRVHILALLSRQELCVTDIAETGRQPERHFPPASDSEANAPDQIPPGGEEHPLLSG